MKAKLAFFLALTFISLLTTPLVVHIIDDAKEITSLLDKSEEENKNEEFEKDIKLELKHNGHELAFEKFYKLNSHYNAKTEHYFLELCKKNTPPPELKL